MKKIPLIITGLAFQICFISSLKAQYTPDSLFSDLQVLLDNKRAQYNIPGAGASIILKNGNSWNGVSGYASQVSDPVDTLRSWHWASFTKHLTATLVLQLQEAGLLSINDPLGMYLDADTIQFVDSTITIKSLLNHTTSLGDAWEDNNSGLASAIFADRDSIWNIWDVLNYTPDTVPNPTHVHDYKPLINYLLLGFIIESATGNSYSTEVQNRIFTPLGMNNSVIGVSGFPTSGINGIWDGGTSRNNVSQNAYISTRGAAGWLISTVSDVTKFMNALHTGQVLSSLSLAAMRQTTPGSPIAGPVPCGGNVSVHYGLGTLLPTFTFNSGETFTGLGHSGTGNSKGTSFHFPDSNFTLTVVGNDYSNSGIDAMYFDFLCWIKDHPVYYGTVSLEDKKQLEIILFPNPASNQIRVSGKWLETPIFSLLDRYGKKYDIKSEKEGQFLVFDLSQLPPGLYILRVSDGKGLYSEKVLIE